MCGINGVVKLTKDSLLEVKIQVMNNRIRHRGPNDDGVFTHEGRIALGMRRLSIIDIAHGKQPIFSDDGDLAITFNGEIYNYLDLKKDLQSKGISFQTQSDTEVVLKLYELYKEKCVDSLNGMFAFAIHSKKAQTVFIARDRFGEKPLYYAKTNDSFIWASELKSIIEVRPELKELSIDSLNVYLALSYIPAPLSIYKDVYKLKSGHYLTINTNDLSFIIKQYWDVNDLQPEEVISYEEAKLHIRELLFESVEKRMIADVPLGVFLSGGVDSTIIAAIMSKVSNQKIKTFSVGYSEKKYDESDRARLVANHIHSEHHEYTLDYAEILPNLENIVLNYDEPFADSSALPTYFISEKTVQKVTVALTGDGGDEVFAGYNKYLLHTYGKTYKRFVPKGVHQLIVMPLIRSRLFKTNNTKSMKYKIKRLFTALGDDVLSNHFNIISLGFNSYNLLQLMNPSYYVNAADVLKKNIDFNFNKEWSPIKIARYIDKQTSLEGDMLVKVDRASMLTSLECRAPFLDHRIFEYTYKLPDSYLLKGPNKKRILKDTFADLLPDGFFNAPKSGFEIPVSHWLRSELRQDLIETLQDKNIGKHGFFHSQTVQGLIKKHMDGDNHSYQLWVLYCFQKWYNKEFAY